MSLQQPFVFDRFTAAVSRTFYEQRQWPTAEGRPVRPTPDSLNRG